MSLSIIGNHGSVPLIGEVASKTTRQFLKERRWLKFQSNAEGNHLRNSQELPACQHVLRFWEWFRRAGNLRAEALMPNVIVKNPPQSKKSVSVSTRVTFLPVIAFSSFRLKQSTAKEQQCNMHSIFACASTGILCFGYITAVEMPLVTFQYPI
ncbi:hypothetical protein R1flu_004866 [Riccia fluitans]|uniref:Uncharacterized protein n=1 Tax=Riccia fluitans TaxID=41844 RepID=A0ABD1YUJ4_9MARC